MTNIKERILYFIDFEGLKKEEFFKNLGLSYANFKGIQKKSALGSDAIDKILTAYPQLNAEWLITGRGDMIRELYSDGFTAPVLDPASIDIGTRIRTVRERNNYSLTDFAEIALKLDKSQYSKIEQGKLSPTLKQCILICAKFSVSMDWLIFGYISESGDAYSAPIADSSESYKQVTDLLIEKNHLLKEIIALKDKIHSLEKQLPTPYQKGKVDIAKVAEP